MIWFFTSAAVKPVAENVGKPGWVARAALMAAAAAVRSFAATFASAMMSWTHCAAHAGVTMAVFSVTLKCSA